jgi:hypothetical protein
MICVQYMAFHLKHQVIFQTACLLQKLSISQIEQMRFQNTSHQLLIFLSFSVPYIGIQNIKKLITETIESWSYLQ